MGRFSDSPHFLLKTFFDGINNTKPINVPSYEFDWLVKFVSSFDNGDGTRTFGDNSYTILNTGGGDSDIVYTDYRVNCWNRTISYDANIVKTFNSYIVAPMVNITTKGGGLIDLFVRDEDSGYLPIKVRYVDRVGDQFNFTNPGVGVVDPGNNIVDILSGDRYTFTFWDKIVTDTFGMFENNQETYFRKDSLYHEWLILMAKDIMLEDLGIELDIRNYVNSDKIFSYFHNIFKSHDDQSCRVIFDGMKNFVMRAVPEHQRTPRFTELCNIFFDQLYQEIFDLMKNIWSLIDPMEVDQRYLGYLSKYYDMFDVNFKNASLLQIREFVRDMIWMIKRKGTYTEFYILWRILTATKNRLNVYERWHRKDVEIFPDWPSTISPSCTGTWPNFPYFSDTNNATCVPELEWRDTLYTNRDEYEAPQISAGAGAGWYNNWYPKVYETDETDYASPSEKYCTHGNYLYVEKWIHSIDNLWYVNVHHNLNIWYPIVMVWDTVTNKMIRVEDIEFVTNNIVRVVISNDTYEIPDNRLIVRVAKGGVKYVDNWESDGDYWYVDVPNNLNIEKPVIIVWDMSINRVICASDVETFGDIIRVTISNSDHATSQNKKIAVMIVDGYIRDIDEWISDGDDYWSNNIEHNLDIDYPIMITWDNNNNKIISEADIEFIDSDNIKVVIYDNISEPTTNDFRVVIAGSGFLATNLSPSGDNLILSPHYILETDISTEPLSNDQILSKEIWDSIYSYWEYIRPVNRVANYRILVSPITDMFGKYINMYSSYSKNLVSLKTISYISLDLENGAYVHNQKNDSTVWHITHNIGENIVLQVFDNDLNEIIPDTISFTVSTATLTFETPNAGFAIMRKSDWSTKYPSPVLNEVWRFYHLRRQKEVIVNYKYNSSGFYSKDTILSGDNYADVEFSNKNQNTISLAIGNFIFAQTTPSKVWDIPHYLLMRGVMMSVYTFDNVRLHPDQYKLIDSSNCRVEFDYPISGYIVLCKVGDLSIDDIIDELESLISTVTCQIYTYDPSGQKIIVDGGMPVKVYKDIEYYYFDFFVSKNSTYVINEIDLFDSRGDELFNSIVGGIYKPAGVDMVFHYRLKIPTQV